MSLNKEFGKRLKKAREASGLTQDKLVELLNGQPSLPTLRAWEKGTREPRISDINKICKIIKYDSIKLILGDWKNDNELSTGMKETLKEAQELPIEDQEAIQRMVRALALQHETYRRLNIKTR